MPPKRVLTDAGLGGEDPTAKKNRLAEAIPDMVAIPNILPRNPKLASQPPKQVRIIPTNAELLALGETKRTKYRQEQWLARTVAWDEFTTPGGGTWKGEKVLGQGSYGIAGLFRYTGPNKTIPQSIVVKQCGPAQRHALIRESRMLAELTTAGSNHIVKLFKSIFYTGGTGVHPSWDPIPYTSAGADGTAVSTYAPDLQVSKIYLEYCEQGDMWGYLKRVNPKKEYPSEAGIWRLLECYVRGLCVLATGKEGPDPEMPESEMQDSGSEGMEIDSSNDKPEKAVHDQGAFAIGDPNVAPLDFSVIPRSISMSDTPDPIPEVAIPKVVIPKVAIPDVAIPEVAPWRPIVHFDVKLDNLFVGKMNSEHQNPPRLVHKFADFGFARHVPDVVSQDFMVYGRFCGAEGMKPPEQMYRGAQNNQIGAPGDLWCVAASLYNMILGVYIPTTKCRITFMDSASGLSESYETQGSNLLALEPNLYSNTLLNLLMRCLAFNVVERPSLASLKDTVNQAIAALNRPDPLVGVDPFFDYTEGSLQDGPDIALLQPLARKRFRRVGSLALDNANVVQDMRARVDLIGFAPAGAASDTIDGNTAAYSVQPVKFNPILSTPAMLDQVIKQQQQQQIQNNLDVSEYNLDG